MVPFRAAALVALVFGALLLQAVPAGAQFLGRSPKPLPQPRSTTNTELVLTREGHGQSVTGFLADTENPFDPIEDGYPTENPKTGFSRENPDFAGLVHARPTNGGQELSLYCIEIHTGTFIGFGYGLGAWEAANVPNVDYVARLLDQYYPKTLQPATLTNLNQKAAAVQAAIWFFSDRYVLSTSDPLHDSVVAIVDHVLSQGPVIEPRPSLTVTPPSASGHAGSVVGPFTVGTDAARATVTATGGGMFSDPAGRVPIPNGAHVPSGKEIWMRSLGSSVAVLQASAEATVPSGNVYLYDGNGWADDAQKLILARTATLHTHVQATAEFHPPGSLTVTKTIAGPAAGSQGRVVIAVTCDDGASRPDFIIRAGAPGGSTSHTYHFIPAGTLCTVNEESNGSVVGTDVVVEGDGQEVSIPPGGHETVKIADTYSFVGSLLVRKTIAGPAAGQQGEITIHTTCNKTALTPDIVIAAGAPAGEQTKQYDDIPAPASCTVTETADGHTNTVSVVVDGSGQTVPVPAGRVSEAAISDTYGLAPGELEVTKTITGPLAGQQGAVTIHTVCNSTALSPDLVIPAGTAAGNRSQIYSGLPAGANCVATETADGHTGAVAVDVMGNPQTVTMPPGGAAAVDITDIYGAAPGSLLITKSITGPLAGQQGPVTVHTVCDGSAMSPDFVIAAGTSAGAASHSIDGIPAGSKCTVTESADGATATVAATVSGNGQTVEVPAGGVVAVSLTDTYQRPLGVLSDEFQQLVGHLKVTKTIAGPAAHHHGPITILVTCGSPLKDFVFHIPAHTGAGSVSRFFPDLPAGTRCTVTETADGRTEKASEVAGRKHTEVTLSAHGPTTAHLTDIFSSAAPVTG